jgi:hypothetical protein
MGTGTRINADDTALSYGLFLACRGDKYIQHYTVIQWQYYYIKKPLKHERKRSLILGGGSFHAVKLTPVWSHVGYQLPPFPQATGLTTFPQPTLFLPPPPPATHTRNTNLDFEDDIGTPEALSVRHMYTIQ